MATGNRDEKMTNVPNILYIYQTWYVSKKWIFRRSGTARGYNKPNTFLWERYIKEIEFVLLFIIKMNDSWDQFEILISDERCSVRKKKKS